MAPAFPPHVLSARRGRGFSLVELLVTGVVILLLFSILNVFLTHYQGEAERELVDLTLRNMRTGLRLHVMTLSMEGKREQIVRLADSNPITWLGQFPADYLGELSQSPPEESRGWYFSQATRELVYRPLSAGFPGGKGQELHWRVEALPGQDAGARIGPEVVKRQD